jgi:glutamate/tyrosine decarboxylase-like PLP-dependent enzyme
MNPTLQQDRQQINDILAQTQKVAERYYEQQDKLPPSLLIYDNIYPDLPEKGIGAKALLEQFGAHYAPHMANSAGPRYFGFVTGGSTPAAVAGDWLVSVYDQVMSGSNDSVAHVLERQALHFLKQLFGLDDVYSGTFVTGATMSNFVSLATARQWVGQQRGYNFSESGLYHTPPVTVISATPHSSIPKSLAMLGMGRNALTRIDTLPDREAIDLKKLEYFLAENEGPVIVVANAGTVNTVDFDDLEGLGALKQKYNFWLHVDAAFGGFAAASPRFEHYVKGLNHADSITIDAHKWLNVPYDAAMQFTRHKDVQVKVFQNQAAYLGDPALMPDSMHFTPENSRRFRALPAWFTLMAYGREGHRDIVERNCDAAFQLGEYIWNSSAFRLLAPVRMNVVCFTLNEDGLSMNDIREFLEAVRQDGQVFFTPTLYKGVAAIRAAISNWQTSLEDIRLGFEVLMKVRKQKTSWAKENNSISGAPQTYAK